MSQSTKVFIIGILGIFLLPSCAKKGEPNQQGELLSSEQIKALSENQSMNGKLVTIEGYPSVCGFSNFVTAEKKNMIKIYPDGFCEGEAPIDAKIFFKRNSTIIIGNKERNMAKVEKEFTNESMKFITDDYQEVPNGKLKFSGLIFYDNDHFYLDKVTIHN